MIGLDPGLLGWLAGWLAVLVVTGGWLRPRRLRPMLVAHAASALPAATAIIGPHRSLLGLDVMLSALLLSVAGHTAVVLLAGHIAGVVLGPAEED